MKRSLAGVAALAMLVTAGPLPARAGVASDTAKARQKEATRALTALINRDIRAEGSFFTPAEQKLIIAKCGYRAGEWDGFQANMADGAFYCTNGRRIDDPEMHAVIEAAAPRIERRVKAVMDSAPVREAIARITAEATAAAMQRLDEKRSR
jgi:hypothetical protein